MHGAGKNYPLLSAMATVGPISWTLKGGAHTMRSASSTGEPSFIFSMVNEKNPELFYCVVMPKGGLLLRIGFRAGCLTGRQRGVTAAAGGPATCSGNACRRARGILLTTAPAISAPTPPDTPKDELSMLEDVLGKLTHFHATKPEPKGLALPKIEGLSMPKISMPNISIPDASGITGKVWGGAVFRGGQRARKSAGEKRGADGGSRRWGRRRLPQTRLYRAISLTAPAPPAPTHRWRRCCARVPRTRAPRSSRPARRRRTCSTLPLTCTRSEGGSLGWGAKLPIHLLFGPQPSGVARYGSLSCSQVAGRNRAQQSAAGRSGRAAGVFACALIAPLPPPPPPIPLPRYAPKPDGPVEVSASLRDK
jgi:hypothetical protein